jgi:serine/threonine protein phosphatase PrpC
VSAYIHVDAQSGKRMLHVANAGDSRAVLCRNITRSRGGSASNNVEALTRDHKPSVPQEQARIEAAGGDVIRGRVMGMLAVGLYKLNAVYP